MAATEGTPCLLLGFTREELDAMEERAFPDPVEAWIHGLIGAALRGEVRLTVPGRPSVLLPLSADEAQILGHLIRLASGE